MRRLNAVPVRLLLGLTCLLAPGALYAQTDADAGSQRLWTNALDPVGSPDSAAARAKTARIPVFRIVPGFLSEPLGLDTDDSKIAPINEGPDWVQVTLGNDNPFFDFRRPGDPGGVGYYKLHSQLQVFDSGTTSFALGLQAVTPAGLEQDGLSDGPTVVSPSLCLFHTLNDGTTLQSFIGKNMDVNTSSIGKPLHRNVQYGLAVQRPLVETGPENVGNFYLFVEALGRYRYDAAQSGPPAVWEMVPGVHWRMTDNLWLSGGVLVPVGTQPATRDARLWQFTCSFQF